MAAIASLRHLTTQAVRLTCVWSLVVAASVVLVGSGSQPRNAATSNDGPQALRAVPAPYEHAALNNAGWSLPFAVLGTTFGASWSRYAHGSRPGDGHPGDEPLTTPDPVAALAARAQLQSTAHGRYGSRATTIPPPTL
jgi:hypothetical protein